MRKKAPKVSKSRRESSGPASVHICGTRRPSLTVLPNLLLAIFMSPLLVTGAAIVYWAVMSNSCGGPIWAIVVLPLIFGIGLIALYFYVMWRWCVWIPGITITRFELVDRELSLHTPQLGAMKITLDEVVTCYGQHSDGGTTGWWIRLKEQGWAYLQRDYGSANELADELAAHVKSRADSRESIIGKQQESSRSSSD